MKYLKRFNESIKYITNLRENGDLQEILFIIENSDLKDEFDNRIEVSDWYSTNMAECLDNALKNDTINKTEYNHFIKNTFTVRLEEKQDENDGMVHWGWPDVIHWIEPKIWNIIKEINARIEHLGYKVIYNDFGNGDICYELIIGDKNY
jgi:hypothetical protein